MDAAVPVDAKNARPPGTWKTAENAVSHSAHTHYCFRERMIENGESTSVAKPSTESDQAHRRKLRTDSAALRRREKKVGVSLPKEIKKDQFTGTRLVQLLELVPVRTMVICGLTCAWCPRWFRTKCQTTIHENGAFSGTCKRKAF